MSDRGERNVGIRPWQWGDGSVSHCSSGPRAHGDANPPIHSVRSPTAAGPVLHAPRSAGPRSRQIPPTSRRGGRTDDGLGGQRDLCPSSALPPPSSLRPRPSSVLPPPSSVLPSPSSLLRPPSSPGDTSPTPSIRRPPRGGGFTFEPKIWPRPSSKRLKNPSNKSNPSKNKFRVTTYSRVRAEFGISSLQQGPTVMGVL